MYIYIYIYHAYMHMHLFVYCCYTWLPGYLAACPGHGRLEVTQPTWIRQMKWELEDLIRLYQIIIISLEFPSVPD